MTTVAVAVFAISYVLIATEKISKVKAALGGAAIVVILGIVGSEDVFYSRDGDRLGRHLPAVRDDDHRRRAPPDGCLRIHRDLGGQAGRRFGPAVMLLWS